MDLIKTYQQYIYHINEGLIKTYDGNIAVRSFKDRLPFSIKTNLKYEDDKIFLCIDDYNYIQNNILHYLFDSITSIMTNAYGWFPSSMRVFKNGMVKNLQYNENYLKKYKDDIQKFEIIFYSKFDEIEKNIPDKMYNLSIMEYDKKIRKYGLSPKSKSKLEYHPDRIYLCKNIEDCKNLINPMKVYFSEEQDNEFYKGNNRKYKKDTRWVIYEIDYSNMINDKSSENLQLHKDPKYIDKGFYILYNIDPIYITKFESEI